nr:endonuclease/exonuclease/phosphatase family protein [Szabonella alba]
MIRFRLICPGAVCRWLLVFFCLFAPLPGMADRLRVATWHADLSRDGPGLLLRDLLSGQDAQSLAAVAVLQRLDADILLLTDLDYDHGLLALTALADLLQAAGLSYPHRLALAPNRGVQTGLDLDGDGRIGGARDAQGFGRFAGQGGMALLSRLPLGPVQDFSGFLWRDLPGSLLPAGPGGGIQRLSSTGHWAVPVILPGGGELTLLAWHATPPVFDGPIRRNAARNHDETIFWQHLIEGRLPFAPPDPPFVLLGDANLDAADGDGMRQAISTLLSHPALQDPAPRAPAAAWRGRPPDPAHKGDPALDTALYDRIGGLRVDYILPSAGLNLQAAGVLWPPHGSEEAAIFARASRHYPVWVDILLP